MPLSRRQEICTAFLVGSASLGLCLLLHSLNVGIREVPMLGDNQEYFFISERVASGHPPYTSQFDAKNSLGMLLWGLAIRIGRIFGVSDVMSARVLSLLVIGASAGAAWLVAYRLTGSRRAGLFSALAFFSFPGYIALSAMGCRPKSFGILFTLLTIDAASRRKPFRAGFCASLAFLCWQPELLLLGALLLSFFLGERRWRDTGYALLGAILPIVLYESYFILTGTLPQQIEQAFLYPARYMRTEFTGLLRPLRKLARLWVRGFGIFNVLPFAFFYGLVSLWRDTIRRRGGFGDFLQKDRTFLFFALSLHGTLAFTYYTHQGYADYFLVFPFIAIVSGWALDRFAERASRVAGGRAVRPVSLAISILLLVPSFITTVANPYAYRLSDQYRLAEDVGSFLAEGKTVYCIGCVQFLAFNHAENWISQGIFSKPVNMYLRDKAGGGIFEPTINGEWPEIVLLGRVAPAGSQKWLSERYVDITSDPFRRQDIRVFALKSPR
jgi:hypothetical protein